ncbi:hypothetical protein FA10DRAFT_300706 [Acaromyces ingoldii]|uniref:Uncharacterized protein n=1 Tax=Acaromyces ingoldii TaxID=215250 RepID=A0A316YWL5_9BASI|nr:hypothetical protein FA10DRAFT_300706 [Acaromyces ingoldii]PWN92185.1 hypothetical protein FA10DRAFT_300706 [Acaromyces ingoldii]
MSSSQAGSSKPSSVEANLKKALELKEEGNRLYAEAANDADALLAALRCWHTALLHCAGINSFASMYGAKSTPGQDKRAQDLTVALRLNLAACYIKEAKYDKAIYATTKVLETDDKNLKALYRRSLARLRTGDLQRAAQDLDLALEQSPRDPSIRRLAAELVEKEQDRIGRQGEEEARKADEEERKKRSEEEAKRHDSLREKEQSQPAS